MENVSVEDCDIFAYVAALLAMEEVHATSGMLPGVPFEVVPIATGEVSTIGIVCELSLIDVTS